MIRDIWTMLLAESSTSQALRPMKTTDFLKMEEMHHWKLSEEEERKGSPLLTGNIMVCEDWEDRPWMGRKKEGEGSAKSKHSPFMSSQLAASIEGLSPQSRLQRKKLVFF